ncbi:10391_t:CDS:2 [Funneliformis mosseae]|uniref:10391_t:CDS:1 n=1 Tax=Funneliformis mosseae TaxID=27381 RepID=A0A9N9CWL3_FUNMO|nr:10391_t:CDS:2 [Funneliformis mosseae]
MHKSILSLQFPTIASKPLNTTIASEPSTNTLEIQTDTSKPFQLEVLALIIFEIKRFQLFPLEFQNSILAKYIMQTETKSPLTCLLCNVIIELTREEADNEELMTSLGLDQATSPIVIEDDTSENNDDERTPDASNCSANVQDNLKNTPNEIAKMIPRIQLQMMGIIILLKIGH